MDKTAIRSYAVDARRNLMDAVRTKMASLYIYVDGAEPPDVAAAKLRADGIFLTQQQMSARQTLCSHLAQLGKDMDNEAAFIHVLEEVAYTWFNRLIALRYMEVNNYLPSGIRILSSVEAGRFEPDAMRMAETLDFVDQKKIAEYRADTNPGADERLYKYILIAQCNTLHEILPNMFQKANDYTELLLPDALLSKGGIVFDLVNRIHEDNFNVEKEGQIEIVGWLYQYYISEKKDEVFAGLKKNIKINKDTIPAATQLFTPEWIVKYMVENSLGRLWLESHPNDELRAGWKYYIDEAEQEPEVAEQLRILRSQSPVNHPEDIKLIDPCMGSGHILVYAFDVLFQIYRSVGHSEREIPNLILQNNLYGLDIDDRAGQLAYFALMMKARSYNRRFFRQESIPQPKVMAIRDSEAIDGAYKYEMGNFLLEKEHQETLNYLLEAFRDAKEYGSILKLEPRDYEGLTKAWELTASQTTENFNLTLWYAAVEEEIPLLIEQAIMLTQKYDVVVTNPPYMGANGMGATLSEYTKKNFPNSKSDMSTVFMERTLSLCNASGYMAMINIPVWMFLSSYENLRHELLSQRTFISLLHFGRGIFGADFGSTSFVINATYIKNYLGLYRKLYTRQGAVDNLEKKLQLFFSDYGKHLICQDEFLSVPGLSIAYSASSNLLSAFKHGKRIGSFSSPKQGLATADNNQFLRFWFEVSSTNCGFSMTQEEAAKSKLRWFPYNKGGGFKKWYGNNEYVINWENDGFELRNYKGSVIRSPQFYFKECLSWCKVTISGFSMRYIPHGFLFDVAGCSLFDTNENMSYVHGFANSKVNSLILSIISPTVNYEVGHVASLPILGQASEKTDSLVNENVMLSRTDWDSFETSWDFKTHPLVSFKGNWEEAEPQMVADDLVEGAVVTEWSKIAPPIAQAFDAWERFADSQFQTLKANEEELNRIFIDIYGLQDELTPEVEDKDVTVRKADLGRDIRSFVSYAVGCMFGRYSLDEPGLIFAGGDWEYSNRTITDEAELDALSGKAYTSSFNQARYKSYHVEDDNIIPIGSADYFDDDIVSRFVEFVRTVYGESTLGENLDFIADALYPNGNGTARERIRRYFLNDFYKDHLKIYQKRPIYWLMDSGKKDGFKALFYLHRYNKYTIAMARTDYLHPLQRKYEAEITRCEMLASTTENAREKAGYRKEIDTLQGKIDECRVYDQVVSHLAHQQIELDLDDGVKVNYEKFQSVDVPKGNKTEKMNLLGKI